MGLSRLFVTSMAVGALALVAVSAYAQHRGGGGHGGAAAVGRAVPRAAGPGMGAPRPVFAPRATMAPRFGPSRFASPAFATPRFGATRFAGPRTFGAGSRPAFASRGRDARIRAPARLRAARDRSAHHRVAVPILAAVLCIPAALQPRLRAVGRIPRRLSVLLWLPVRVSLSLRQRIPVSGSGVRLSRSVVW